MQSVSRVTLIWAFAVAAIGCGGAEIGEPCDQTGSSDECVDGAICDTEGEDQICLAVCKEDSECPTDRKCTGVSGSNVKACHPK